MPKPQPTSLEEEYQLLTAALGWAISRWARVEDALGYVFAFIVSGDTDPAPAKAAMDAVFNFKTKVVMIGAAANWALSQAERASWKTLGNRLIEKAKQRNELAHFTIVEASPPYPDGRTYSLSPHLGDLAALVKSKGPELSYDRDQLRAKGEAFDKLTDDLNRFVGSLRAARAQPPAASS